MNETRKLLNELDQKQLLEDHRDAFSRTVRLTTLVCRLWEANEPEKAYDLFRNLLKSFECDCFSTAFVWAMSQENLKATDTQLETLLDWAHASHNEYEKFEKRMKEIARVFADEIDAKHAKSQH